MNEHANYLYSVSYRMERGDFVALSTILTRRRPIRIVAEIVVYFGVLLAIAAIGGGPANTIATLINALTAPGFIFYVPLILLGPALLLLSPQITGLIAAFTYKRSTIADRDITLHLTAEGIEGGPADLYAHVGWGAVLKLVETPEHLFIQISRREAMIIPRRAVANEDQYNNVRGFVRARTGLSTSS